MGGGVAAGAEQELDVAEGVRGHDDGVRRLHVLAACVVDVANACGPPRSVDLDAGDDATGPDLVATGVERHGEVRHDGARLGVDLAAVAGAEPAVEATGPGPSGQVSVGLGEDARGLRERVVAERLGGVGERSEEHTSELQSLMRISYAVFCLKKKK